MTIENFVFDFDGTLTDLTTGKIPNSTFDAIKQLHLYGFRIIIATGRPFFELDKKLIKQINPNALVLNNGRVVMDGSFNTISDSPIPENTVQSVLQFIKNKNWDCGVHLKDYTLILSGLSIQKIIKEITHNETLVKLNSTIKNHESIYNIMVKIESDDELKDIQKKFPELKVECFKDNYYDIYPKNSDKSTGIELFFKMTRSNWSHTVVFGDGLNDKTMLTKAYIGYVMEDGHNELKLIKGIKISKPSRDEGISISLMKLGYIEPCDGKHGWYRFKHRFLCTSLRYTLPISIFLFIAVLYDVIRQVFSQQSIMLVFLAFSFLIYSFVFYCKNNK